jgi:hypothetical protein
MLGEFKFSGEFIITGGVKILGEEVDRSLK